MNQRKPPIWQAGAGLILILLAIGCTQIANPKSDDDLSEFCASVLVIDPDNHVLLNWRRVTRGNTEQINDCIRQLGITNVRVLGNLSELRPVRAQT